MDRLTMKGDSLFLLDLLFSLFIALFLICSISATTVGVTYSTPAIGNTPKSRSPEFLVDTVSALKIPLVRLPDPSPSSIRAFLYSNVTLLLSIPNALIPSLAANRSTALTWLYIHVVPFHPRARISAISVGNNVLDAHTNYRDLVFPAVQNVDTVLHDLGVGDIAVSTTFSFFNIMTDAFPPSFATFQEQFSKVLIHPLLDFLEATNSSFMVNIYPYNLYRLHCEIPLGFALFQENSYMYRDDRNTGVRYWNLFDMMVDAVVTAMSVAGHHNIPVVVAETGWPSSSTDASEMDATEAYSAMYVKGLLRHVRSGVGTPLKKEGVAEAYVYELVDEEQNSSTRNWGILYSNLTAKYPIKFFSTSGGNTVKNLCSSSRYYFLALLSFFIKMTVVISSSV